MVFIGVPAPPLHVSPPPAKIYLNTTINIGTALIFFQSAPPLYIIPQKIGIPGYTKMRAR